MRAEAASEKVPGQHAPSNRGAVKVLKSMVIVGSRSDEGPDAENGRRRTGSMMGDVRTDDAQNWMAATSQANDGWDTLHPCDARAPRGSGAVLALGARGGMQDGSIYLMGAQERTPGQARRTAAGARAVPPLIS